MAEIAVSVAIGVLVALSVAVVRQRRRISALIAERAALVAIRHEAIAAARVGIVDTGAAVDYGALDNVERAIAAYRYDKQAQDGPSRTIRQLKAKRYDKRARAVIRANFAVSMEIAYRRAGLDADLVTWIPSPSDGIRGFGVTYELAAELGLRLGLPVRRLILLNRVPTPQKVLRRADRVANIAGAYRAMRGAAGRRVLVVDDVITTGATVDEAGRALRAAGASLVCAIGVAGRPVRRNNGPDRI